MRAARGSTLGWADRRASTAVEFAVIGMSFVGMLMFVFQLGFRLYTQIAIDYATSRAARLLQVDSTQSLSGSPSNFQTATFCPLLAVLLKCQNILVELRPVTTDYLNDSQVNPPQTSGSLTGVTPTFSAGGSNALMLLRVTYVAPFYVWPLNTSSVTYNGASGSAVISSAPFENEY
jgi:hypothetical protein